MKISECLKILGFKLKRRVVRERSQTCINCLLFVYDIVCLGVSTYFKTVPKRLKNSRFLLDQNVRELQNDK